MHFFNAPSTMIEKKSYRWRIKFLSKNQKEQEILNQLSFFAVKCKKPSVKIETVQKKLHNTFTINFPKTPTWSPIDLTIVDMRIEGEVSSDGKINNNNAKFFVDPWTTGEDDSFDYKIPTYDALSAGRPGVYGPTNGAKSNHKNIGIKDYSKVTKDAQNPLYIDDENKQVNGIKFDQNILSFSEQAHISTEGLAKDTANISAQSYFYDFLLKNGYKLTSRALDDMESGDGGYNIFYDFFSKDNSIYKIYIYELDSSGFPIERWIISNPIFNSIDFGSLDYSTDQLMNLSLSITYDYAEMQSLNVLETALKRFQLDQMAEAVRKAKAKNEEMAAREQNALSFEGGLPALDKQLKEDSAKIETIDEELTVEAKKKAKELGFSEGVVDEKYRAELEDAIDAEVKQEETIIKVEKGAVSQAAEAREQRDRAAYESTISVFRATAATDLEQQPQQNAQGSTEPSPTVFRSMKEVDEFENKKREELKKDLDASSDKYTTYLFGKDKKFKPDDDVNATISTATAGADEKKQKLKATLDQTEIDTDTTIENREAVQLSQRAVARQREYATKLDKLGRFIDPNGTPITKEQFDTQSGALLAEYNKKTEEDITVTSASLEDGVAKDKTKLGRAEDAVNASKEELKKRAKEELEERANEAIRIRVQQDAAEAARRIDAARSRLAGDKAQAAAAQEIKAAAFEAAAFQQRVDKLPVLKTPTHTIMRDKTTGEVVELTGESKVVTIGAKTYTISSPLDEAALEESQALGESLSQRQGAAKKMRDAKLRAKQNRYDTGATPGRKARLPVDTDYVKLMSEKAPTFEEVRERLKTSGRFETEVVKPTSEEKAETDQRRRQAIAQVAQDVAQEKADLLASGQLQQESQSEYERRVAQEKEQFTGYASSQMSKSKVIKGLEGTDAATTFDAGLTVAGQADSFTAALDKVEASSARRRVVGSTQTTTTQAATTQQTTYGDFSKLPTVVEGRNSGDLVTFNQTFNSEQLYTPPTPPPTQVQPPTTPGAPSSPEVPAAVPVPAASPVGADSSVGRTGGDAAAALAPSSLVAPRKTNVTVFIGGLQTAGSIARYGKDVNGAGTREKILGAMAGTDRKLLEDNSVFVTIDFKKGLTTEQIKEAISAELTKAGLSEGDIKRTSFLGFSAGVGVAERAAIDYGKDGKSVFFGAIDGLGNKRTNSELARLVSSDQVDVGLVQNANRNYSDGLRGSVLDLYTTLRKAASATGSGGDDFIDASKAAHTDYAKKDRPSGDIRADFGDTPGLAQKMLGLNLK